MLYYASLFGATGLWRNWLAHWTVDPGVAGSSPVDPANLEKSSLPRGVMVAPQILILLVGVRVPARQPFYRTAKSYSSLTVTRFIPAAFLACSTLSSVRHSRRIGESCLRTAANLVQFAPLSRGGGLWYTMPRFPCWAISSVG